MIITIDIGGTQIKYGRIQRNGIGFEYLGKINTHPHEEDFSMLNRINDIVERVSKDTTISGIAISTAGIVEPKKGEILFANQNIPGYQNTKLRSEIEKRYKVPCSVENDVNAALLGELNFGEFHGINDAMMITVGTGIGAALFLNGQIYHGSSYSAGEIGYSFLGNMNVERLVSTSALVQKVKNQIKEDNIDGYWVFEQAKGGNQICQKEIRIFADALMKLVMNCISLINPQVVILGGGIMEQKEFLEEILLSEFARYKNDFVREKTRICFASLGNHAGMLGAFEHFRRSFSL